MDFNSLAVGSPIYVITKGGTRPKMQIGSVKSKNEPRSAYPTHTPNLIQAGMVLDIVVSMDGSDVPFNNLPTTGESTTYNGGNTFVSCSREATLQEIDSMMHVSRKARGMMDYHEAVEEEGEKMKETLNPSYAEGKRQARIIKELQDHVGEQERKLDSILNILQKLDSPIPKRGNP